MRYADETCHTSSTFGILTSRPGILTEKLRYLRPDMSTRARQTTRLTLWYYDFDLWPWNFYNIFRPIREVTAPNTEFLMPIAMGIKNLENPQKQFFIKMLAKTTSIPVFTSDSCSLCPIWSKRTNMDGVWVHFLKIWGQSWKIKKKISFAHGNDWGQYFVILWTVWVSLRWRNLGELSWGRTYERIIFLIPNLPLKTHGQIFTICLRVSSLTTV